MPSVPVLIPGEGGKIEGRQEFLRQTVQRAWDNREPFDGLPSRFDDFRRSENIEDRRNEPWWMKGSGPSLDGSPYRAASSFAETLFPSNQADSPLSKAAGYDDLPVPDTFSILKSLLLNGLK